METNDLIKNIRRLESINRDRLHLTANENRMSNTAASFLSTRLSERYFFGGGKNGVMDLNPFKLIGFSQIADLVVAAEKSLKKSLGAGAVNLNCLSGLHAMTCTLLALTKPGDLILTINKEDGGHFATKSIIKLIGRNLGDIPFNASAMEFDCDKLAKLAKRSKISAIYLDASYYLKPHNIRGIRKAVGSKTIIIYDASHTLGLIIGHNFQRPLSEGADVICGNTHKTFPGPQKGIIAFKSKKLGDTANRLMNSSLYSSVHTHHLIALAVTILEMEKFGRGYAQSIVANAQALGQDLSDLGYSLREVKPGIFTQNHQIHVYLPDKSDKAVLFRRLVDNGISVNFDRLMGSKTFIRIGVQEVTRLGMTKNDMSTIAELIDMSLKGKRVKSQVSRLLSSHKRIKFSFDR